MLMHVISVRCQLDGFPQGVLAPMDAQLAVRAGVDGVILRRGSV